MTHRQLYDKLKEVARLHNQLCSTLGSVEQEKFGFEFAQTDSDRIIDSLNYGIDDYNFDEYLKEMKFYKKSFDKTGSFKENGIY